MSIQQLRTTSGLKAKKKKHAPKDEQALTLRDYNMRPYANIQEQVWRASDYTLNYTGGATRRNWRKVVDENGHRYYYNAHTGYTSWDRPGTGELDGVVPLLMFLAYFERVSLKGYSWRKAFLATF
jgi:hypothetical protein